MLQTHYPLQPTLLLRNTFPHFGQNTRNVWGDKKYAFPKPFETNLAAWNGRKPTNSIEWPPPPELIIVHYLAGADVNIHTTGHSLLFKYASIRPPNGVCGSCRVCGGRFLSEIEDISPSGNWLQHRSARTSRWHKGSTHQSKWGGGKFEGVSSKSARRPKARPRTFHFNPSAFIYLPD